MDLLTHKKLIWRGFYFLFCFQQLGLAWCSPSPNDLFVDNVRSQVSKFIYYQNIASDMSWQRYFIQSLFSPDPFVCLFCCCCKFKKRFHNPHFLIIIFWNLFYCNNKLIMGFILIYTKVLFCSFKNHWLLIYGYAIIWQFKNYRNFTTEFICEFTVHMSIYGNQNFPSSLICTQLNSV